ncbi:DUF4843 domain-containing protein [Pedobacter hiemivivus]|uniref:DUF4843 domain-containing protein n=1 Tax=Pedobacter hiemivivus TaxID=2530454 RepID=A0A4R0NC43_9SPHI|nr:DUF4843 domain-containing protein [Pedobacter hiemivivus]TCC97785.1 DUF4843 domain-containing protein [Pedobacter hiemivivus]
MKRNIYVIAVILFFFGGIIGCKKDLKTYEGEGGIYFPSSYRFSNGLQIGVDSTLISFAYAKTTAKDSTIFLPVKIDGKVADIDREFKLSITPASTAVEGTHYEMLSKTFIIPANQITGVIGISLKRTPDMLDKNFLLVLKLEENTNFKTLMQDVVINTTTGKKKSYIQHTLWINDILKKPRSWLDTYMGPFSRKKLFLLADLAEINDIADLDNTSITTIPKTIYYGTFMQRYLNEMRAMGKTIYEEDGVTEMIMGPSVQ